MNNQNSTIKNSSVNSCCTESPIHLSEIEYTGVLYWLISLIALIGIYLLTGPMLFGMSYEAYYSKYAVWFVYLAISIVSIGITLWHLFSYNTKVNCMIGMMIGMTIGMQTGMMVGAVLGATNGFFFGALVAMILGVIVGTIAGRCCGVMGIMEGMMAGLMGGTMGPMITVMMLADNVHIFMPFYMLINLIILFSMSYMFLKEHVAVNKENSTCNKVSGMVFFLGTIIVGMIIYLLIVYGPKSFIVQ